ncbi:hypothetical protein MRX96_048584 [Rhipicephalus microplus]
MLVNRTGLMKEQQQLLQVAKMLRGPCRETGPLSAVSSIHASCCHGFVLRVERNEQHRIFANRVTVAHLGNFCASNPVAFALNGDSVSAAADDSQWCPFGDAQSSVRWLWTGECMTGTSADVISWPH